MSPSLEHLDNIYITGWTTESSDRNLIEDVLVREQPLVIANASFFYLDMPHSLNSEEPGLPWAAYVDCERIHQFEPLACWEIVDRESVKGLQAQLWTETVTDDGLLFYYLFPRLLAVADRAWRLSPGNWPDFALALGQRELSYLDSLDIAYRLPPAGARIADGTLHANVNLPGLMIRYSIDDTDPGPDSPLLDSPLSIEGVNTIRIAVFSPDGRRSSRVEIIDNLLDTNLN